jgi:hypothetical protein
LIFSLLQSLPQFVPLLLHLLKLAAHVGRAAAAGSGQGIVKLLKLAAQFFAALGEGGAHSAALRAEPQTLGIHLGLLLAGKLKRVLHLALLLVQMRFAACHLGALLDYVLLGSVQLLGKRLPFAASPLLLNKPALLCFPELAVQLSQSTGLLTEANGGRILRRR